MTALQGKIAVAATALVLTALMLRQAAGGGLWVELLVTETQVLTAMAVSWWVLSDR
jgi:hypothetical protein